MQTSNWQTQQEQRSKDEIEMQAKIDFLGAKVKELTNDKIQLQKKLMGYEGAEKE